MLRQPLFQVVSVCSIENFHIRDDQIEIHFLKQSPRFSRAPRRVSSTLASPQNPSDGLQFRLVPLPQSTSTSPPAARPLPPRQRGHCPPALNAPSAARR